MLDSKVVESVKSLTAEEREEFILFLKSPYFVKRFTSEELLAFYDAISRALVSPDGILFTKEVAHGLLFPDKPFNEGRMDRIMFELNRMVRQYLLTKHYHREENEIQQTLDWISLQRSKGAASGFEKQFQKLKDTLKDTKSSVEKHFLLYLISLEEHEWQSTYNKAKGDLALPEVIESMDHYYMAQKIEMLNRYLLQQRLTSLEMPEIIKSSMDSLIIPPGYLENSKILFLTEKIHQLLRANHPSKQEFQLLMEWLVKFENEFPPKILAQFYSYLRNFCALLIDSGNNEFEEVLHELHKDNLKRGYFYFEGKIQPNAVFNINLMALRLNRTSWAKEFVEEHKGRVIGDNEPQDFYRMNIALCLFAEKKYEEALELIPFNSTHVSYQIIARRLELKIYYELQSELLPSKIDAFKMYVSRASNKSFSPEYSELYSNFGNFVHQLSLSIPGDKKRSEQLTQRIKNKKLVAERAWLLEKAEEIGNAKKK